MKNYNFNYREKDYNLSDSNFDYMLNDEEHPVSKFYKEDVLKLLNESNSVNFEIQYYDGPCEACLTGKAEKAKTFKFLEFHFYIFTKDSNYIISNISKEYENTSFNLLLNSGKIDNSYIVSVMVCENCGHYSIEIEQCDM